MNESVSIAISLLGVGVATAVVFSYLVFIWWLDRYEREPFWLVLITFMWGAFGGTCFGCALSIGPGVMMTNLLGADTGGFLTGVVVAPLSEEFTKALVFLGLLLTKHLDNETDGLIYGAATGLGFATVENLLYYATAEADMLFSIVVVRTMFTALVHCISSAIIGMSIGYARHRQAKVWPVALGLGYIGAVVCHGTWNLLASLAEKDGLILLVGCGLVVMASGVMFALTQFSLMREHNVIKDYLGKEAQRGTIPMEHATIIPYWSRRRKTGWLAPGVDHEAYVKAATLLAFRQHQLAISSHSEKRYLTDIAALRERVLVLLSAG